ncbi:MAG: hypothetical protein ABWX68_08300 [Arthrobacter sp.]|uniref:hypothetical protein n=1 Tax=Arthrobacter sp. TaxID=1667 RepID=UPI0034972FB4
MGTTAAVLGDAPVWLVLVLASGSLVMGVPPIWTECRVRLKHQDGRDQVTARVLELAETPEDGTRLLAIYDGQPLDPDDPRPGNGCRRR